MVRNTRPEGCRFKTQPRPDRTVRGEYLAIQGKEAKGIMRCGHIERKEQGRTA